MSQRYIAGIFVFAAALAQSAAAASPNSIEILEPCKDGLELSVRYQAAQAVDAARPQTLKLRVERGGQGEVTDVEKDSKNAVTPEACQAWQKFAWPAVDRMITQSRSKARASFQCINTALIRYELGGKHKRAARVCLGDAAQDGLTKAFYRFWDQTGLLARPARAGVKGH